MIRDINTIIVDDNQGAITKLENDLKARYDDIMVLGGYTSLDRARNQIIRLQPDLLFLDVEMPDMTGMDFLESLRSELTSNTQVIFYTAHNKYLIDALRASAFDFLLKPYLIDELDTVVERVRQNISVIDDEKEQASINANATNKLAAVHTTSGLTFLKLDDIVMFNFSSENRCWIALTSNSVKHKLRSNVISRELLALSTQFISVNQHSIVNVNYIATVESKNFKCTLVHPFDNIELISSRRSYTKIKASLTLL